MGVLAQKDYDFVFAIGDDWTDEFMFQELPEETVTVKVGLQNTQAKYFIESVTGVRGILQKFI